MRSSRRRKSRPIVASASSNYVSPSEVELYQAARDGNLEIFRKSSNSSPGSILLQERDADTSIVYATRFNRPDMIRFLLKSGANIDARGSDDSTPLHIAAKYNYCNLVQYFLDEQADPTLQDNRGQTPLHVACRRGHLEAFKNLVKAERPFKIRETKTTNNNVNNSHESTVQSERVVQLAVDILDNDDRSPLHLCAANGNSTICAELLSEGANPTQRDISDMTPCMLACAENNIELLKVITHFCEQKKDSKITALELLSATDDEGFNALHHAVQNGQLAATKICIEYGVDINAVKANRYTALHMACVNGFTDVAELLLAHNADLNSNDSDMRTPFMNCAIHNRFTILKLLHEKGADSKCIDRELMNSLHHAARLDHVPILEYLIKIGLDTSSTDNEGKTPLHWAVFAQREDAILSLLSHGDTNSINQRDSNDRTVMHYAASLAANKILEMLITSGADLSAKDTQDQCPLHIAAKGGFLECAAMLTDKSKHERNDEDIDGRTPLLLAALNGHSEMISLLFKQGGDVSSRDENRCTALILAARHGHLECLRNLLQCNADINAVDRSKDSALHYASRFGFEACVELLLNQGAKMICNNKNQTPIDLAIKYKHSKTCSMFFTDETWSETMNIRDHNHFTPMKSLIEKVPDIAEIVLDRMIEETGDPYEDHYKIIYNFESIHPHPDDPCCSEKRYSPLVTMVEFRRQSLLEHPLVQLLLKRKWKKFARYFFYIDFMLYLFFLTLLTLYILENEPPTAEVFGDNGCPIDHENYTAEDLRTPHYPKLKTNFLLMVETFLYVILTINVVHQLLKMAFQKMSYFRDITIYFYWILFVFTLLFILPPGYEPCQREWNFGAMCCFLAWSLLVFYFRQFEFFGLYLIMFNKVLMSMLKSLFIFSFFLMAFSEAFHIMLARQRSFSTLGLSIIRVFVMAIGEIDYNDTFVGDGETDINYPFTTMSEIIFAIFLFMMPIVLMNLLVGIAVGDIDSIKQQAYVEKLKLQIDFILDLETKLPKSFQRRLHESSLEIEPNKFKQRKGIGRLRDKLCKHERQIVFIGKERKTPLQDTLEEFSTSIKQLREVCNTMNQQLQTLTQHRAAVGVPQPRSSMSARGMPHLDSGRSNYGGD